MSLIRKQTTEAMVAANRSNTLKSTGPVTDVGKMNVRLNALKHGIIADRTFIPELGEKEEDLKSLCRQLVLSFQPQDRYEEMILDQMTENRFRRQRLLRAEAGILAGQALSFELDYGRKLAGDGRSPEAIGEAGLASALGLAALPDSSVKFNLILQCLRAAREAVEREGFGGEEAGKRLETVYGPNPGLAGTALLGAYHQNRQERAAGEAASEEPGARAAFLESLAAEIACFEKLLELHEKADEELAQTRREAQSALSEADSRRLTRYEAFLDRQFDRLLKQLNERREAQRQEALRQAAAEAPRSGWGGPADHLDAGGFSSAGELDESRAFSGGSGRGKGRPGRGAR